MRSTATAGYEEIRDAISHDWCRALEAAGARFVLLPNALADPVRFFEASGCDALLLSNGDDPGTSPRDTAERALLQHAVDHGLPTLGVCRGLQVIASFFGGRVASGIEALPDVGAHVGTRHPVRLSGELERLFGAATRTVNSFHRHGVLARDLPAALEVTACAAGDVVEGLAHRSLPIWGLQWHPERPSDDPAGEQRLLRHFAAGFPKLP